MSFRIGLSFNKDEPGNWDINDEVIPKIIYQDRPVTIMPDLNCNIPFIRKPQNMETYGDLMTDYKKAYDFVYLCGTSVKEAEQKYNQ